jgi:hypothetical protein
MPIASYKKFDAGKSGEQDCQPFFAYLIRRRPTDGSVLVHWPGVIDSGACSLMKAQM